MKKIILISIFLICFVGISKAAIIKFVSGGQINCEIINREANYIRVLCDEGIPVREYLYDQISNIIYEEHEEVVHDFKLEKDDVAVTVTKQIQKQSALMITNETIEKALGVTISEKQVESSLYKDSEEKDFQISKLLIFKDLISQEKIEEFKRNMVLAKLEFRRSFTRFNIDKSKMLYVVIGCVVFIIYIYIIICYPVYSLSKKLATGLSYFAWIPVLNLVVQCRMANVSAWWLIMLFVPVLNGIFFFVFQCVLWFKIAKRCDKPAWFGFLSLIPFVFLIVKYYLSHSYKTRGCCVMEKLEVVKNQKQEVKDFSVDLGESEDQLRQKILGNNYKKRPPQRL